MTLRELIEKLMIRQDQALNIMLPDFSFVPEHFHVTEVGKVHKEFIDCGGTKREKTYAVLQVWVANDFAHRLTTLKLVRILNMAGQKLGVMDLPVEIEYETNAVAQYPLADIEFTPGGVLFHTGEKHTACLAPDKCGVSECCGGVKGCC